MDYSHVLDDAFHYTKEGIFGSADRWMKLILATICLGIPMNGYVMRIYRGADPAPEVEEWGTLFVDGLKLIIVGIIYAIPVMIVWVFVYGSMMLTLMQGNVAAMEDWSPNVGFMGLMYASRDHHRYHHPGCSHPLCPHGEFFRSLQRWCNP